MGKELVLDCPLFRKNLIVWKPPTWRNAAAIRQRNKKVGPEGGVDLFVTDNGKRVRAKKRRLLVSIPQLIIGDKAYFFGIPLRFPGLQKEPIWVRTDGVIYQRGKELQFSRWTKDPDHIVVVDDRGAKVRATVEWEKDKLPSRNVAPKGRRYPKSLSINGVKHSLALNTQTHFDHWVVYTILLVILGFLVLTLQVSILSNLRTFLLFLLAAGVQGFLFFRLNTNFTYQWIVAVAVLIMEFVFFIGLS
jgi:hypothetical protein